ncbi:MAG: P-loop NTPase [Elusimicrobiota bacterium]
MKNELVIDPRQSVFNERLKKVKKIILVTGFKGGIGKSVISSGFALSFAKKGYKVGLLDLDITSSTDHIILGVREKTYPAEDKGILPPVIQGIKFMSFSFFSKSKGVVLRGNSLIDAIREIFCVTIWGELDILIIDMPAGFSDIALEILRIIKRFNVIAVSTPSPLSKEVLKRMLDIYKNQKIPIFHIENMAKSNSPNKNRIFFDKDLDAAIGSRTMLTKTNFFKDIEKLTETLISFLRLKK